MSIAGIRSNRGDHYQTLVAFSWALEVLSDDRYKWIEVDSTNYLVDDVVVGMNDGTLIACQCKKNQKNFEAWSVIDLSDEIEKAAKLLEKNKNIKVYFYSRNNFGRIGKLKEYSTTQHNEDSYKKGLSDENKKTDTALCKLLTTIAPDLTAYELLCRTEFETSSTLERMDSHLRERLRSIASNPIAAFNALWVQLDNLGARTIGNGLSASTPHRLTKRGLEEILHQSGALLVPTINMTEARRSFSSVSAIGRSWRRDIGGRQIQNPIVKDILDAIDSGTRSILITGSPGSGKTCVMLEVQETLEQRAQYGSAIFPIFIQSRDFADLDTSQERKALGLPEQWVGQAARIAECERVVVLVDSLDVLSIAREHRVLTYFLAQIDRLLLTPNISLVTACRDFDKRYDYQIAERRWDYEVKCPPLDWTNDITPLLERLGIDNTSINKTTRDLIKNYRELALFVEIALRKEDVSVITSQALAQRYLDVIVRDNKELGEPAIKAIEDIASEMLVSRRLSVPRQRFTSSQATLHSLSSLNIVKENQDGKLTFGHQTLLDALVISRALRSGVTLNQFIQNLTPVPFVRPTIRSFVAQLASGEQIEFRRQIRTVLTGDSAFHIRRLVAESFSENSPLDDYWPLIRELRAKHRDIFQVIYTTAKKLEWHYFWIKYLAPTLKAERNAEHYMMHALHISRWINDDTQSVVSFWMETLSIDWVDCEQISRQLPLYLSEIKTEKLIITIPLLKALLTMPYTEHSFLGNLIARCIESGIQGDDILWQYITSGVNEEAVLNHKLTDKLRCSPHDFHSGHDDFIQQRMSQSAELLNLAVKSIKQWSDLYESHHEEIQTNYKRGFLCDTSYDRTHSQRDMHYANNLNILLDAVEFSILHHAKENSYWWLENRQQLLISRDATLLYFLIKACIIAPKSNTDLITLILCNNQTYELHLNDELAELIQSAFIFLDDDAQDAVTATILNIHNKAPYDHLGNLWALKRHAKLIIKIPCHIRSPEAQTLVEIHEKYAGVPDSYPHVQSWSGIVSSPFPFQVFLELSDSAVVKILNYYSNQPASNGADFLLGGKHEVAMELQEASSRNPTRFLGILSGNWPDIPTLFRDYILDGAATYLAHRHGNLQASKNWVPIEEPESAVMANLLLTELENHSYEWLLKRSAAKALEACANVVQHSKDAERLINLATAFKHSNEAYPLSGDSISLISQGINMAKGKATEALMILASNATNLENRASDLLKSTLFHFAQDQDPVVRALIIRRLPYLQSKNFELGWGLFHLCMKDAEGLWQTAEPCLYYSYHNNFSLVEPFLTRLRYEGKGDDLESWGRISALCSLSKQIFFHDLIIKLQALNSIEAWRGAASVWTNIDNIKRHQKECFAGLEAGLNAGDQYAIVVSQKLDRILGEQRPPVFVPLDLIKKCFHAFEIDNDRERKNHRLIGFHDWLTEISQIDPELALAATNIYLEYIKKCKPYFYDHTNKLTMLMTRLFAEAEEREESDGRQMLMDVVNIQDMLLSLGFNGVTDWLKAAERP